MPDSEHALQSLRTGTYDVLAEWKLAMDWQSSGLNRRRRYDREFVDAIHQSLTKHFRPNFFQHTYGQARSIKKSHFITRLLTAHGSPKNVVALHEACMLLDYAAAYHPTLYRNLMQELGSPIKFNATLFEIYVARGLDHSMLPFRSDAGPAEKPLDGELNYGGHTYSVECKKLFSPAGTDFDVMYRSMEVVMIELDRQGRKRLIPTQWRISLRLERPCLNGMVNVALNATQKLIEDYNSGQVRFDEPYLIEEQGLLFKATPPSVLVAGETTDEKHVYIHVDIEDLEQLHAQIYSPLSVHASMSYTNRDVVNKLIGAVKDKRDQHRAGSNRLIIFLDSQELPDLQLGLLQENELLSNEEFRNDLIKEIGDSIVCVLKREYTHTGAATKMLCLRHSKDRELADRIRAGFMRHTRTTSTL